MKTKKNISLAIVSIICLALFGCPKKKNPEFLLHFPVSILVQNTSTAATISTIHLGYNNSGSLMSINQVSGVDSKNWTLNYHPYGRLKNASYDNGGSINCQYYLSYDTSNNRLNKVTKQGKTTDMLNLNYLTGSSTYVGSSGTLDGVRIKVNASGQLDNIQNWLLGANINLTYLSNEKGLFANKVLDESVVVFMNLFSESGLTDYFYHSQQISNVIYSGDTHTYQNYVRDDKGNITSFDRTNGAGNDRSYTITYKEIQL